MKQILILDFGSQYTQLIARRLRELEVYCEIMPFSTPAARIASLDAAGVILSGGPSSVYGVKAPQPDPEIFNLPVPILGVCYGMQLLAQNGGGSVKPGKKREYGLGEVKITGGELFKGLPRKLTVWMSHGDCVKSAGKNFKVTASTADNPFTAFEDRSARRYGVQFHPEVAHTQHGADILRNFARGICAYTEHWTPKSIVEQMLEDIHATVGPKDHVLCALSGGVDSSVAAALLSKAVGKRLYCIFVDTGLLRKGDREKMQALAKKLKLNLKVVDAESRFLGKLKGVSDPEKKRKIIGKQFIEVFEAEAKKIKSVQFLAQGTLYPDVIESVSVNGPSAVIKSHHNVGGLPKRMKLKLVEPLRFLFKDEVRALGRELGISEEILMQHPFPGPGLGVRILGQVTKADADILREADFIFRQELASSGWDKKSWQAFAVLLPVRTVGVMGDERTYEKTCVLRAVNSVDGMTADFTELPYEVLKAASSKIVSRVRGINRVVYDITSKPPSTIEWE